MCLRLLEAYLDDNEDKTLYIYCDECGNWDLSILNRELVKLRQVSRNETDGRLGTEKADYGRRI